MVMVMVSCCSYRPIFKRLDTDTNGLLNPSEVAFDCLVVFLHQTFRIACPNESCVFKFGCDAYDLGVAVVCS